MGDKFQEIVELALSNARAVDCSRSDFIEGLKTMRDALTEDYELERDIGE